MENTREKFEYVVYSDYLMSTGLGGCITFMPDPEHTLHEAELFQRDGDTYKREDVRAMWFGWCHALQVTPKNIPETSSNEVQRLIEELTMNVELMTEASHILEEMPADVMEKLNVRYPLGDELHGAALIAKERMSKLQS